MCTLNRPSLPPSQVPTDRPDILFIIRITYVLSQLIQFGLFYYASLQIKKKNDTRVLKYQEPPKAFAQVRACTLLSDFYTDWEKCSPNSCRSLCRAQNRRRRR